MQNGLYILVIFICLTGKPYCCYFIAFPTMKHMKNPQPSLLFTWVFSAICWHIPSMLYCYYPPNIPVEDFHT